MTNLSFEDILVDVLPTREKSFDNNFEDSMDASSVHEISEIDEVGNLIDVQDIDDEELGNIKSKSKSKRSKKRVKSVKSFSNTAVPTNTPVDATSYLKKVDIVRKAKGMGTAPHSSKRHIKIPLIRLSGKHIDNALFVGTKL